MLAWAFGLLYDWPVRRRKITPEVITKTFSVFGFGVLAGYLSYMAVDYCFEHRVFALDAEQYRLPRTLADVKVSALGKDESLAKPAGPNFPFISAFPWIYVPVETPAEVAEPETSFNDGLGEAEEKPELQSDFGEEESKLKNNFD